jgi:hypothetical protein
MSEKLPRRKFMTRVVIGLGAAWAAAKGLLSPTPAIASWPCDECIVRHLDSVNTTCQKKLGNIVIVVSCTIHFYDCYDPRYGVICREWDEVVYNS